MQNITQFIKDNNLGKFTFRGREVEIGCPFKDCANHKEPQFYISLDTGAWYCHRCEKKGGNLKRLKFALGLVELQDPIKTSHVYIPESKIDKWTEDLFSNKEALNYLTQVRCFEEWVIRQFRLGYKMYDGSPVICIPYFDKHDTCVGVKYDFFTRPAGTMKYIKEKDSKTQFFNLNHISLNKPLIITEGEYDAIAGFQYGMENIGSVPNGAQGLNGWVEEITGAEKYILFTDNDSGGQRCAELFGERIGYSKCSRVFPRLKDLSDALQSGIEKEEIEKWLDEEEPMFKAPVTDITSYIDKAIDVLENPNKAKGVSTGWNVFDFFLGGIRDKEVTVISGKTGNGKTTFGMALIGNLVRQGVKCLIISPEMREEKLLLELANNQFRKQVTKDELKKFIEMNQGKVQLANVYGQWTETKEKSLMSLLFDLIDYSVKNTGVKFVFIDHLRLFTSAQEDRERREIDEFMKKCVRNTMMNNIHIFVVVQPRKLQAGQRKVTGGDLKGSVNIEQDAHNILLVHREEKSNLVEFDLEKNRELGTVGTFKLQFNKESMSNYEEISNN